MSIAIMMFLFGAATLCGYYSLSGASLQRVRGRLIGSGQRDRQLPGGLMVLLLLLIFSKLDKLDSGRQASRPRPRGRSDAGIADKPQLRNDDELSV